MTVKDLNSLIIGEKAYDKVSIRIIEFCKEERNIYEIIRHIGYKNRTRFRRDYINPLVEKGILRMTVPDKPTSKNQKYIKSIIIL